MQRKTIIITAVVVGISALAAGSVMAKAKCHGMHGGYMSGMSMMGPGMHGQGMTRGFGKCGCGDSDRVLDKPLTVDDVRMHMESRLKRRGNDRLKVGAVTEVDETTIIAEIVTVDESLVKKIQIDKTTGRQQRAQ